jgi:hypothetical protein
MSPVDGDDLGSTIATTSGMGAYLIPALIAIAVLVAGFLAWELYFTRSGQRAMVDQHHAEGDDEPPKNF